MIRAHHIVEPITKPFAYDTNGYEEGGRWEASIVDLEYRLRFFFSIFLFPGDMKLCGSAKVFVGEFFPERIFVIYSLSRPFIPFSQLDGFMDSYSSFSLGNSDLSWTRKLRLTSRLASFSFFVLFHMYLILPWGNFRCVAGRVGVATK